MGTCIAESSHQRKGRASSGGLFVMETVSVILQVGYFKFTHGKRLFRMAPLHHHFQALGWPKEKVVMRYWVVSVIFATLGVILVLVS